MWLDLLFDLVTHRVLGNIQIVTGLQIDPELWCGAEVASKAQCGVDGHAPAAAHEIIQSRPCYLERPGEAILSDCETHGIHLDNIVIGEVRAREVVHDLGEAIREDDEELAEARQQAREQRRHARQSDRLKLTTGTSAVTAQAEPARKVLWQLRRVYDWDGRSAERDRQALALERWETLKENWNRQVERAEEEGVHVIYTKGYKKLRQELTAMADDDLYLDERANSELRAVILRLDMAEEGRAHVEKHRDLIAGRLEHRREVLQFGDSWDKRAVPDREHYEAWRDGTDEAAAAAEGVLANRRKSAFTSTAWRTGARASPRRCRARGRCLQTTTATLRRAWCRSARARTRGCARTASPVFSTIPTSSRRCASSARPRCGGGRPKSGCARADIRAAA